MSRKPTPIKSKKAPPLPYEVGYGRPPIESRFERGVSGNPKGRPKGSLNLTTTFTRVLRETVVVTERGKKKTITKLEAAVMQLTRLAIGGDVSAIKHVLSLAAAAEQRVENEEPITKPLGRTETKMLNNFMKRFDGSGKKKSDV